MQSQWVISVPQGFVSCLCSILIPCQAVGFTSRCVAQQTQHITELSVNQLLPGEKVGTVLALILPISQPWHENVGTTWLSSKAAFWTKKGAQLPGSLGEQKWLLHFSLAKASSHLPLCLGVARTGATSYKRENDPYVATLRLWGSWQGSLKNQFLLLPFILAGQQGLVPISRRMMLLCFFPRWEQCSGGRSKDLQKRSLFILTFQNAGSPA